MTTRRTSRAGAWSVGLLAALALTGCASQGWTPREVAHIRVETVDSEALILETPWFVSGGGAVLLRGQVRAAAGAAAPAGAHLDVRVAGPSGDVLHEAVIELDAESMHRRGVHRHGGWNHHWHAHAGFEVELGAPIGRVATIELRAHDGEHGQPRT